MEWAHTLEDRPAADWEPLDTHLTRVGDRCAALAAKFGAADLGRTAGRLHDLGKAKPAFQAYLQGGPPEPHAGEGARAACEIFPTTRTPVGRLLAFAIAGHHAGLANARSGGGGLSSLEARLGSAADLSDVARRLDIPARPEPPAPLLGRHNDAFAWQFFTRMLFSCLVDADRLETEAFYAAAMGETVERGWPGTLGDLKRRLDVHLAAFGPPRSTVAEQRAEVLAACRAAAGRPPGLFTLTVPTGGGKTLSSLAFALDHAIRHGLDRVIYVIPYTSIIEQTAAVFRDALDDDAGDIVLEHHSAFEAAPSGRGGDADDEGRDGAVKLRRAAENWDRPVIVTTAVQAFESLFANRPSRCRKLHALARAVIVLDEAQTLPLRLLRPCLAAGSELARGYGSSVVLCTATQPAVRAEDGFEAPEALTGVTEIAPDPKRLHTVLERVTVRRAGTVSDDALVETMAATPQILTVVNNRRHARALADRLIRADVPGARLLTTALTAVDRRAILEGVRDDLEAGRPVRLVATSLIEAGVDIDFPTVWRATAGIESIAQAAGRCNREGRLDGPGDVVVFEPEAGDDRRPPPDLVQFAEVAASVLRDGGNPLSPDTVREYFAELYWRRGIGELDAVTVGDVRGVMAALSGRHAIGVKDGAPRVRLDYPFADLADAFRLIEDTQAPVVIPAGRRAPGNAPADLLDALRSADRVGGLARRLQPFLVQVPRRVRHDLLKAGVVETIRPERFGDQFVVLAEPSRYDPVRGLDWADPETRDIEADIF